METTIKNKKRIVPLAVFMGGMLIYLLAVLPFLVPHNGLFFYYGDYNVQQVPFLIFAHRAVHQGRLFWNPLVDLGGNMGGTFAFYLWGSPFFWLTIPFPEAWLPYMTPFLMALKFGTASLTSYLWIRTQTRTDGAAVLGAYLYAFSGFQACNIVFQHFHDVTAFFPLYLLAFDRFIEGRRSGRGIYGFTLMTALMSIINYYFFFGQVVFLVLYYLVRYGVRHVKSEGVAFAFSEVLRTVAAAAVGLLLSAFFLVQSISGIMGNSRVSEVLNGYDLVAYPDSITPLAILKSFFMVPDLIARGTLFSSDNIRNGSLAFYLPCFAMGGVFAFWMLRRISWKKTLLAILGVMAFVPVLCAAFSAFNDNFYTRWFYMPVLLCACMTAEVMEEKECSAFTKGAVLSLAGSAIFILLCYLPVYKNGEWSFTGICENRKLLDKEILATIACSVVLLVIVLIKRRYREMFPVAGLSSGAPEASAAAADASDGETAETSDAQAASAKNSLPSADRRKTVFKPGYVCILLTIVGCIICTYTVMDNGSSLISFTGFEKWRYQMLTQRPLLETADSSETEDSEEEYPDGESFSEKRSGNNSEGEYPGNAVIAGRGVTIDDILNPEYGLKSTEVSMPDLAGEEDGDDDSETVPYEEDHVLSGLLSESGPMDSSVPSPFARAETDSTSTNYEMVWGIPTMHCFESTVHPSIFKWYRGIGMIRTVESTLPFERIGARALMSVRYYLENDLVNSDNSYTNQGGIEGYSLLNEENGYNVYTTENFIPMGISFDNYISEDLYDSLENGAVSDRILVKDLILSDEMIEKYGNLMKEDINPDTDVMPYSQFREYCDERADSACTAFAFDKNGFHATAQMEKDNLVMFSVPYDKGFSAYVDGKPAEVECVNFGLTAVLVPEGTHEIRFTYMPEGFVPAVLVSGATALLLLLDMIRRRLAAR